MVNFVAATAHTHDYTISATCTSGTACVCGATTGNPVPHTYADDTCKAIGTCTVCGAENPDGVLQEHNYVDGACSVCQQPENATSQTATVTVSVIANTGVLNGDTISWTSGDISVIDQKGGSNSDIRTSDSDHFRVYAYNDFTVSTSNGKLTEVVINCTSSTYAEKCLSSMTAKGYTATQNEKVITITLDGTLDSITCNAVAQFRIDSVKVTYTYMG